MLKSAMIRELLVSPFISVICSFMFWGMLLTLGAFRFRNGIPYSYIPSGFVEILSAARVLSASIQIRIILFSSPHLLDFLLHFLYLTVPLRPYLFFIAVYLLLLSFLDSCPTFLFIL